MGLDKRLQHHKVVPAVDAVAAIQALLQQFSICLLVLGNQTTAKCWKQQLESYFPSLSIVMVDERYSTLEARDRYWQMYPPKGLLKLLPRGLREPPRPVDDIAAILLIERYLAGLKTKD